MTRSDFADDWDFVVSMHIFKTAGTTFGKILEETYWPDILFDYPEEHREPALPDIWRGRTDLSGAERKALANYLRKSNVRAIHGHFFPEKYAALEGKPLWVTFLRDPLARVVSQYYFAIQLYHNQRKAGVPVNKQSAAVVEENLSIADYIERFAVGEHANLYAVIFRLGACFDMFNVIGTSERFDDSLRVIQAHLPGLSTSRPALNVGTVKREKKGDLAADLPPDVLARFLEANAADYEVFAKANARLDEQLARLDASGRAAI